jgi:hypothetical protein
MTRLTLILLLALGLLSQVGCAHRPAAHRPGVVKVLPPGHRSVHVNGRKYFLHQGTYYQPKGRGFVKVRGPMR